jgi:hypothetical protein
MKVKRINFNIGLSELEMIESFGGTVSSHLNIAIKNYIKKTLSNSVATTKNAGKHNK